MPGTFTYNPATNLVTVTGGTAGSPADFASFLAADRAGSLTLLNAGVIDADPDTFSLTTQPRPCEKRVLKLKIVTSADRAGATLDIAGTDGDGDAISETGIDISGAATAAVYTTLKFATVDAIGITANGLTNGDTVTISQDQWGVLWQLINGNSYRIDSSVQWGDGSNSTFFTEINKHIYSDCSGIAAYGTRHTVKANATVTFGVLYDLTNKLGYRGCSFIFNYTPNIVAFRNEGNLNFYGCALSKTADGDFCSVYAHAGLTRLYNCILDNNIGRGWVISGDAVDANNLYHAGRELIGGAYNNFSNIIGIDNAYGTFNKPGTWRNLIKYGVSTIVVASQPGNAYLIDAVLDNWDHSWYYTKPDWTTYRQHSFNFKVVDMNGNAIPNATIVLKDINGTVVFSVASDITGKITEQVVTTKTYTPGTPPGSGYYSTTVITDYGPFTLTITKAGYQDYQDVITIDRKMDLEVALGLVPPPVYVNVPSGEVAITLSAPESLEVSLEAGGISVELSDGL